METKINEELTSLDKQAVAKELELLDKSLPK